MKDGRLAGVAPEVATSNSGKCTSPSPRSARGSRAQRSATWRVRASSRWASASVSPSPDSRAISSAISSICLPDLRKPSAFARSTCRRSRATSRRAASRTSTTGASRRSAYRTALVSTVPTPALRANPAIRAAWGVVPGPQALPPVWGSRWETSSTKRFSAGTTSRHGARARSARSSRRRATAAPTSELGPSSTTTSPLSSQGASNARSATGVLRSPASWTAETSRQTAAHPARPPAWLASARKVTRGTSRSSRNAPPRTGVRGAWFRDARCARSSTSGEHGLTARSTPSTGRRP